MHISYQLSLRQHMKYVAISSIVTLVAQDMGTHAVFVCLVPQPAACSNR